MDRQFIDHGSRLIAGDVETFMRNRSNSLTPLFFLKKRARQHRCNQVRWSHKIGSLSAFREDLGLSLQHTQNMFSPKWKCRVEEEGGLFYLFCFSRVDRRDLPHPRQKLPPFERPTKILMQSLVLISSLSGLSAARCSASQPSQARSTVRGTSCPPLA
jgi:hypothetical protein